MIEAFDMGNYDLYDKLKIYRDNQLHHLQRIEADLVYYGQFTGSDVARMKPFERRFHIEEINRRFKRQQEQRDQLKNKSRK